jgi:phosphoglycerate dehydrogenase-like enzyme
MRGSLIVVAARSFDGARPEEQFPVTVPVEWRLADSSVLVPASIGLLSGAHAVITTVFTPEMGRAADSLRAILVPAAGYERISRDAVPDGCLVANAYEHEWPVAEWVLMAMIALDHEVVRADRTFRAGSWEMWPFRHGMYRELWGRTLAIIGFGRIGRRVAEVAKALGMRCIAATRTVPSTCPAYMDRVVGLAGLPAVLRDADFLLVATPLREETRGLIGEGELATMKRTAYVINPARGPILDEGALYRALQDRRIAGAAIDTWWTYPRGDDDAPRPSKYPFWELDNVLMTPHHSGATLGTARRRAAVLAENIDRLYRGEPLVNVVRELSKI